MPADRERSLAAGMDDHLAKPTDRERLGAVLQLLKRSQLRHSGRRSTQQRSICFCDTGIRHHR